MYLKVLCKSHTKKSVNERIFTQDQLMYTLSFGENCIINTTYANNRVIKLK